MLNILIRWLVFLHVLAAITFFLAHGTSAAMTFQVRKETDFSRIRALLDLSWSTMILMGVSFLIMGLTGLILPFMIHIWNRGYIWLSIVLMLFVFIYMAMFNETHYKELRRLVGLPYMKGSKNLPAEENECIINGRGGLHYSGNCFVVDDLQAFLGTKRTKPNDNHYCHSSC
jgi:hypothetical protein